MSIAKVSFDASSPTESVSLVVSYNRPRFCPNASWSPQATTFANLGIVGERPYGIVVDRSDTVYISSYLLSKVLIMSGQSSKLIRVIPWSLSSSLAIFVNIDEEIYVDNGVNKGVEMWTSTTNRSVRVMNVDEQCNGLFLDRNNSIYCSHYAFHEVRKTAKGNPKGSVRVAGVTNSPGSAPSRLNEPFGIFVDTNFTLFVADSMNNRIQRFYSGQTNGVTVAGISSSSPYSLLSPSGIVLDADGYLFIVDTGNHRIVRSDVNGFRCIVGCSKLSGTLSSQLKSPSRLSFDSWGNFYVSDTFNNRVQKFWLTTNSCSKWMELLRRVVPKIELIR